MHGNKKYIENDQHYNKQKVIYVVLILLAVASLGFGIVKGLRVSKDFQWDAAKLLVQGENPYQASMEGVRSEYGRVQANQFPSLLLLLFPYTLLSGSVAKIVWLISNLLFLLGICILFRKTYWKQYEKKEFFLFVLLLIASAPIRSQIWLGQHTLFSFFFFLLARFLDEKDRVIGTAIALSVSYFKYSITAPLMLIFLFRKHYKPVIISIVLHIVATLGAGLWLRENPISLLIQPLRVSILQSSRGVLDIGTLFGKIFAPAGLAATLIIFIGMIFWVVFTKNKNENAVVAILVMLSLIFMYHRKYDFFVFVVPASYILIEKAKESGGKRLILEQICAGIFVIGIVFLDTIVDFLEVINLPQKMPGIYNITASGVLYIEILSFYILLACMFIDLIKRRRAPC